jgi:23S rRNA pseudouridine2605 synthase
MARKRIQKYLSEMGVTSRRNAEEMVLHGRVSVNGSVPQDLPVFVDPSEDDVRVDGRRVGGRKPGKPEKLYFLLNKPKGVVCTQSDPAGRSRAVDLVPDLGQRVYCVGRLDKDSTGIIILTNDGELTERLTHPRYEVPKTYRVEITGSLDAEAVDKLKSGMWMDGKRTNRTALRVLRRSPDRTLLEITLTEGRNREIRRMLARLGHKVKRLHRVAIGPITDRGLKVGNFRALRRHEVKRLRKAGADS